MDFDTLVQVATSGVARPYRYQQRIADEGLPDLLAVPTGAGKTMAAVLPWLYRRRYHPDEAVRRNTPRRLVFVLPMRVLAEQTHRVVGGWLDNLGLSPFWSPLQFHGFDLRFYVRRGGGAVSP